MFAFVSARARNEPVATPAKVVRLFSQTTQRVVTQQDFFIPLVVLNLSGSRNNTEDVKASSLTFFPLIHECLQGPWYFRLVQDTRETSSTTSFMERDDTLGPMVLSMRASSSKTSESSCLLFPHVFVFSGLYHKQKLLSQLLT